METVISNAERRALQNGEPVASPRVCDIYAASPAIQGKLELEYEGEQVGAEKIVRDLIRKACGEAFAEHFAGVDFRPVLDHFSQGRTLVLGEMASEAEALKQFSRVAGLTETVRSGRMETGTPGSLIVGCELALEGLHSQKKLARNESRGDTTYAQAAPERQSRRQTFEDWTGGKLN
jgi:magnesium chelatase subunit I